MEICAHILLLKSYKYHVRGMFAWYEWIESVFGFFKDNGLKGTGLFLFPHTIQIKIIAVLIAMLVNITSATEPFLLYCKWYVAQPYLHHWNLNPCACKE